MGLEKSIKSGKEKRNPYRGSKKYSGECRNHGGCSWCMSARQHKNNRKLESTKQKLDEQTLSDSE